MTEIQEKQKTEEHTIKRLENSIHFGIETVMILIKEKGYRLMVINRGKVLIDEDYGSSRGAKIAFAKYFKNNGFKEEIKASWSHSYPVDPRWLSPHLNLCDLYRQRGGVNL